MPDKEIEIVFVTGVEGPSIYIDDYRIVGNKPWGGGDRKAEWNVSLSRFARDLSSAGLTPDVLQEALDGVKAVKGALK